MINLEQNYRSTQNILDAAYGVISQNHSHPVLHLDSKREGRKICLYNGASEEDEARFIAEKLLSLPKMVIKTIKLRFFTAPTPNQEFWKKFYFIIILITN